MSIGGVIGGLFNALVAPMVFNAIIEYQLMLVVACLILPPLGYSKASVSARAGPTSPWPWSFSWSARFFLTMCWLDELPDLTPLKEGPWQWGVVALLLGVTLGGLAAWQGWGSPPLEDGQPFENHWADRVLDVVLPLTLMVLVVGLFWGLPAAGVVGRLKGFAEMVRLEPRQFRIVLTFGLPAVLCYTFVERSVRFGLGVGAILLAAAFCNIVFDSALFQTRSFFGVLRVESHVSRTDGYLYPNNRLVHGTTLHGKQFLEEELHETPLSYYHRTGPVGEVFRAYNNDPKRPMAVIGLGTGTMACYALKGQTLDFFDIDPEVVGISYDTNHFFTFVEDAENRGANVGLVLGDARLTFEPKQGKSQARLKPMHRRPDEPAPARQEGDRLTPDFQYGLIVVDAFSSDAIPVHLITKQALEIYRDRLLPDGILCMHISNRYLNLEPVLANIVDDLGMAGYHMSDDEEDAAGKNRSHWVAIARKKEHLEKLLKPIRWQHDSKELSLLGASLWPAQATTGLAASTGLSYAFLAIADLQSAEKEKKDGPTTSWKPLSTPGQLQAELEEADAELKTAEEKAETTRDDKAKKDAELARKARDRIKEKIVSNRRVGVWTDDYSNLLSVFSW